MQRYHPASCTSAVNNSAIGGPSARDAIRADSSSLPANFPLNSRRPAPLAPYKLKCEKEALNNRLGPPDYYPQTPSCPEENLTREYAQSGYKETVEGLEEAREILLTQVQAFSKHLVIKCKDAIRKRLRAINDSRAQKRKAGQVYGVPLSVSLLTKPGIFPEQKPCSEDFRKKWIEGLSQQHKHLRSLADNVPHGYRKRALFEVLIRNNVPLLRATWFIKITYLNQVRPNSASISCGAFDKAQLSRTEFWTKDVVDYLECLVEEFFSRGNSHLTPPNKDQSPQMFSVGFPHTKGDPPSAIFDGEEPSLHFKWWYVVRLLLWHQAEGLLLPSLIVDWVLGQLEENDVLEFLELLLPIIYGVLDTIVLSQTYVRTLVRISVRFIRDSFPGGSDLVDNSRRAYTTSALVEMVRYLVLAVPDTFVALDCFPFPPCVVSHTVNEGNFGSKVPEDATKLRYASAEVASPFRSKGIDFQYQSSAFDNVVSSIQKCTDSLAKAVNPEFPVCSVAKAVHALDKSLLHGDIGVAYKYLFENCCNGSICEAWFEEVNPCLRMPLKWNQTVNVAFACSVFFLCEWATCDYRDFWSAAPRELKLTGGKVFSQVYIATRLLKMKARDLRSLSGRKYENAIGLNSTIVKGSSHQNSSFGRKPVGNLHEPKSRLKRSGGAGSLDLFESPGPLHDILVCWIDQHEVQKGEGFERVQFLIVELIRAGIFYPHLYVRQLIVSGIVDSNGPAVEPDRRRRHQQILKYLPGSFIHATLDDGKIAQGAQLVDIINVYSKERRLVLHGLEWEQKSDISCANTSLNQKRKMCPTSDKVSSSVTSVNQLKSIKSLSNMSTTKSIISEVDIEELKEAISLLLRFPNSSSTPTDTDLDDTTGTAKKSFASVYGKIDIAEATPGCEDCRRAKKRKVSDEKPLYLHGSSSPIPSDDEDTWWVKKGPKSSETLKVDPPVKTTKPVLKGRRKTQSLAHLAASRIEGSQGASTSHVCDNRVACPHHRSGMEGDSTRPIDASKINHGGDIAFIGKSLKRLRLTEKRAISSWFMTAVKQIIEETEKTSTKAGQFGRSLTAVDDRNTIRWKFGEDQLSSILYLTDVCNDFVSGVKFLLWLLPKVLISSNSTMNSRRSILLLPRNVENQVCEVGEAYLLSSLRRYENVLVAADLISEALSSIVHRAMAIMASNGRISGSAAVVYARHLLKKYGSIPSVIEWEKSFKTTCDKRLIAELDPASSLDGELGLPLGVPAGVEDLDDFFRQKIGGGRLSRVGMSMRELVQRQVDDAFHYLFGKDRKVVTGGAPKVLASEKSAEGYQIAQKIITGLMECIRHTGGAAQEGDPSLVSSAVSAIVGNLGSTVSKMADFIAGGCSNFPSASGSLDFVRRILCIHITCLCLLKEALGERQSRVFEIALATEAFSALAGVYPPGKPSRSQFQLLADSHESNAHVFGDSTKVIGRATKIAAAISALVIGAVIQGVCSLERLVTLFRLKEGLDFIQFVRTTRSNANGNTRTMGMHKIESSIEDYVHWFRLLVGNCRTVFDGLIVELLGEPSIVALFRMQRLLPLSLVLSPAYSIFSFVVWRPFIQNAAFTAREDVNQLCQSLTIAIGDIVRHLPFRDVCLRDSQGFYNHLMNDTSDVEFAAILELNDIPLKPMAFVPLRARLFLNTIIDCKLPSSVYNQDDGSRISGVGDSKGHYSERKMKLLDRLVYVLDTLQPAKFHWQWVELRLLLNEQALIEKLETLETRDLSLADAVRLSSPSPEKVAASDNEKNFIEIILTRLLVRPDAAPLFSDVIHLFGRSLEDSMLLQAKWFLGGQDVLFGRKSIRQRLTNIAESKGLSTKTMFWKPWGWCISGSDSSYLEEGEVVEEGTDSSKYSQKSVEMLDNEVLHSSQQHVTERALIELVLPCIDQSSEESRNTFANDLIKQLNNIEQQINAVTSGSSKQTGLVPSGIEGPTSKGSNRKMKGGSPGLARRSTGSPDSPLPSPAALRASMSLRLQLILRLLPVILEDREPSGRNMRHMLASVILRLLGSRIVHEDANLTFCPTHSSMVKKEVESSSEASLAIFADLPGESLFGSMLLILHGLLSSCQPSWLGLKIAAKSTNETRKDSTALVRELAESLQNELHHMQLPDMIRWRIQAAMPIPLPSARCLLSYQPPTISPSALSPFQSRSSTPGLGSGNSSMPQGGKVASPRVVPNAPGKSKHLPPQQDYDTEIDPWLLLEDGAGSSQSSSNAAVIGAGEHANFRASYWLKGAVRVRRTDLTYIGAMDDDS
ncbi:mediator of RNA polymerase II transcription subunit 12-like [Cucurbita pepo subsp. pepo]|uniref:mediator of RNA polymerase II transcription subunit 12-like n=1 Tax=Cucurbita pepo subsp. pepo TaxID=3664 RepID=UPI000C9D654D|nr:mediator of RNA polymerase II transcription subunit 12-like [Cucurbita pepo subsp. pepo]XP_023538695.1 mediator of RNA polymerase II transcription subunit 12-like [Cucurbita pepo subsp. pepo]XP_023538696.1 mediator of RNA polymerase II transcription subunit 12-like [Cucurbita pepo subsp. pepo]XP_023538697.1 mediator of RNA polymerase II transcription subunit 12-like [Cucurbita pepo subsp. pepo]XP_023538698.1 mediator of RNA polymerase II transcription subunit 12-like [Cucurbita pepo subsp. p